MEEIKFSYDDFFKLENVLNEARNNYKKQGNVKMSIRCYHLLEKVECAKILLMDNQDKYFELNK